MRCQRAEARGRRAGVRLTMMAGTGGPEGPSLLLLSLPVGAERKCQQDWKPIRSGGNVLHSWVWGRKGWGSGLLGLGEEGLGLTLACSSRLPPPQPAAGAAHFRRCLGRGPCSWEEGRERRAVRGAQSLPQRLPTFSLTSHLFPGPQFSS